MQFNQAMQRNRTALWLALIAVIAVAFRIPYIAERSIWYDEASSWQTAQFSAPELLDSLKQNVHMPLYFFLLKGWIALWGDSAYALRGLSIALGVATVVGMFGLAREYCRSLPEGDRSEAMSGFVPLATALLMAVNAFQINVAIETRMYALGTALSAMSAWALLRVINRPQILTRWLAWVATCVLLTYTHHHCLFIVASEFAFVAALGFKECLSGRRTVLARTVAAASAVLTCYVPGAFLLVRQMSRVRQDYWTAPLSWDLVGDTLVEFISPLYKDTADSTLLVVIACATLLTTIVALLIRPRPIDVFALTLGALPMVIAAGITLFLTPVWEGRFFRFAQPFLLLAIVLAIEKTSRTRWAQIAIAGGLAVCMTTASIEFWILRNIDQRRGMKGVVERILEHESPEDLFVVATSNIHYFPAKYYLHRIAQVKLLESATHEFWGDHLIRAHDVATQLEIDQRLCSRIWVLSHSPLTGREKELLGVVVDTEITSSYDSGVPNWRIYASRVVRTTSEAKSASLRPHNSAEDVVRYVNVNDSFPFDASDARGDALELLPLRMPRAEPYRASGGRD